MPIEKSSLLSNNYNNTASIPRDNVNTTYQTHNNSYQNSYQSPTNPPPPQNYNPTQTHNNSYQTHNNASTIPTYMNNSYQPHNSSYQTPTNPPPPQNYQQPSQPADYWKSPPPSAPPLDIEPTAPPYPIVESTQEPPNLPSSQRNVEPTASPRAKSFVSQIVNSLLFRHTWVKISLFLNITVPLVFIATLLWYLLEESHSSRSVYSLVSFIFSIILLALTFVYHFIQVFCHSSFKYLRSKKSPLATHSYVDQLKREPPRLWMHVECYHYHTTHTTHHRRSSDGRTTTHTERRRRKVVTYSETTYFPYQYWIDASGTFRIDSSFRHKTYIKMKLGKNIVFNDEQTASAYRQYAHNFCATHRWRDQLMNFTEGVDIPGFESRVLTRVSTKEPFWANSIVYLIASLFCYPNGLFQLIFLIAFDLICGESKFEIFKRVSMSPYVDMTQSSQHDGLRDLTHEQQTLSHS